MIEEKSFNKILAGYEAFREKYALGDKSVMQYLSHYGQQPEAMVVSCCDSRVDPALILQCDPGDLFVVRNVANIIPPYEKDATHHGTSAALEFGICFLKVKRLILLGHSQCGGIQALIDNQSRGCDANQNDFINSWVSLIETPDAKLKDADEYAKFALGQSYQNCMTFPWLKAKVDEGELIIHRWFFDIKMGEIFSYSKDQGCYQPLDAKG
jgi:carbonic anhydrase